MRQALLQLGHNAINYSPKGGDVAISARYDADSARIVVSVGDQGVGIAAHDQASLFTTFQRLHHPETLSVRGSGLGLYIVKGLAELMGGSVWLESEPDSGSTFSIALPIAASEAPAGHNGERAAGAAAQD